VARIDDFKLRFACFDEAVVDSLFPALEQTIECYYCGDYENNDCDKEIILQLLAHLITVESSANAEARRTVASKSVDGVSVSFESSNTSGGAPASSGLGFFNSTRYGQQYLLLTASNLGGVFV